MVQTINIIFIKWLFLISPLSFTQSLLIGESKMAHIVAPTHHVPKKDKRQYLHCKYHLQGTGRVAPQLFPPLLIKALTHYYAKLLKSTEQNLRG